MAIWLRARKDSSLPFLGRNVGWSKGCTLGMATALEHAVSYSLEGELILGGSTVMQSLNAMAQEIARTNIPVLLTGDAEAASIAAAATAHYGALQDRPFDKGTDA
jgi:hypothetical protein